VGTIGNASCAEGLFWEGLNAVGVLRAPLLLSIWDDDYGISVPNEHQLTKGNISDLLRGFQRSPGGSEGLDVYTVKGWDYPALCETFLNAAQIVRHEHVPAVIHVQEMTQPLGHSTSGSHERYKTAGRLEWEREFDCLSQMRQWMERQGIATPEELDGCEGEDRRLVREIQGRAWKAFRQPLDEERRVFLSLVAPVEENSQHGSAIRGIRKRIERSQLSLRRDLLSACGEILVLTRGEPGLERRQLVDWRRSRIEIGRERYGSDLHSSSSESALGIAERKPDYPEKPRVVNGSEILNACFDRALARYPHLVAFGEDVGKLGDVNQGMVGLQEKYGELRVSDTGIREATILGQAIGLALRGLRPLCEIQYLDYLLYALQTLSDDLATLRWRSAGRQKAPVVIRTRGHRLEGVWHSGSPMAGILNLARGVHICVPRDMTRAAGFYNTLLRADDPAIVIEVLNGYRVKEPMPANIGRFTVPLGIPEILRSGTDVTLVTYGACCRIALAASSVLQEMGIEVEVVDVQTLLPFDLEASIRDSIAKTNRVVFVDEDVPGGATAFMMQQVLERQEAFQWLDSEPVTVTGREHRPAYGSDGDYFSKPSSEDLVEAVYELMHGSNPSWFPRFL
jgi:pyruvate/2-oxoglutarate/acetoin dehydrogenase E1 component